MGKFSFFTDMLSGLFERAPSEDATASDDKIEAVAQTLLSGHGEISGMRLSREVLTRYGALKAKEKLAFFQWMADALDLDPDKVVATATAYRDTRDGGNYNALMRAAEPPRQELLRRLNQPAGATLDLVRMRRDLLDFLPKHSELAPIDHDFRHLFRSWFNRGFLVLRPIDWYTPANILEKIIEYEAVHTINDWSDLRRRLLPSDRRCFAFFHPAMLEEPLIFVEVALCKGIPGSVQALLAEDRAPLPEADLDTAVFYSISNCQEGLRGISFGNSLIKQVVEELRSELPQIRTTITLSPIPGLMNWLRKQSEPAARQIVAASEKGDLETLERLSDEIELMAATWLAQVKATNGQPADPVARFHLGNGAQLHQVHALADISPNGLRQSATAMVNYLYDLGQVEANHEAFATNQRIVMSKDIKTLLNADKKTGKSKT